MTEPEPVTRPGARLWFAAVLGMVVLYAAVFTALNVMRYRAFFCTEWEDLAVRNQMLWNAAHGRLWTQSVFSFPHPDHFEPVEFLLVPFYWLRPHVTTLFALQSLALGLGAAPIYLIAQREFARPSLALCFAAAYLLFGPLHALTLSHYKPVMFSIPCLLFAFHFYGRDFWSFGGCALLALACREDVSFALMAFGIYGLLTRRAWRWVVTPLALGLAWFLLATKLVIPAMTFGHYWHTLKFSGSAGLLGVLGTLAADPGRTLWALFNLEQLKLYVQLLKPAYFLCLLAPETLIALPTLAQAALRNIAFGRGGLALQSLHTLAPAIAFIFLGALYGCKRVLAWAERSPQLDASAKRVASVGVPLAILLATLGHNFGDNLVGQLNFRGESWQPVPDRRFLGVRNVFDPAWYADDPHDKAAWELIRLIPPEASVSASGDLLVPLSHRRRLLEFGMNQYDYLAADYLLLNEHNRYFGAGSYRWFDDDPARNQLIVRALVPEMLHSGHWRLVAQRDSLWLLQRAKGHEKRPSTIDHFQERIR